MMINKKDIAYQQIFGSNIMLQKYKKSYIVLNYATKNRFSARYK
jgi:hypothetical protein